jgi:cell division protein FtsI/penicillin-binding protein 2
VPDLDVAGKTGSAESGQFDDDPPVKGDNGWFVAFAPADSPELVVGSLCLGVGGGQCAPVAGAILREALDRPTPSAGR